LKQRHSLAANAEKLAKRLMQDADEIEIINLDPELAQQLTWFTKGRKFNLTHELRSYSSWLKSAGGIIGGSFSERDVPGQSIRFLADWIRSVFGKDRFGDLAELVQVGYAACGTDKDVDADAVRKQVTRARQKMRKRINENPVKASYPELRRP
jgi:hypothetical protein